MIRTLGRLRARQPTCYIHIGTHKTGTTAIQAFLANNAEILAGRGVLVPISGRLGETASGMGHHCIAWDALGADPGDAVNGSLELLIEEIRTSRQRTVCISSEEFAHLFETPNQMQRLKAGLCGIGYRPIIVAYLRPQADYLEALYAEVARHAPVRDFWACYREVLAHGAVKMWSATRFSAAFDYDGMLLHSFRRIFGARNVIVRAFRRAAPPAALIAGFMRIVTGQRYAVTPGSLVPSVNGRIDFATVVTAIRANRGTVGGELPTGIAPGEPFEVLRAHEIARLVWRFARSNAMLFLRYRVFVGCVSRARIMRILRGRQTSGARVRALRATFAQTAAAGALPELTGVGDRRSGGYAAP